MNPLHLPGHSASSCEQLSPFLILGGYFKPPLDLWKHSLDLWKQKLGGIDDFVTFNLAVDLPEEMTGYRRERKGKLIITNDYPKIHLATPSKSVHSRRKKLSCGLWLCPQCLCLSFHGQHSFHSATLDHHPQEDSGTWTWWPKRTSLWDTDPWIDQYCSTQPHFLYKSIIC